MKHILLALPFIFALSAEAKQLKVMQYNAENFFDTKFDQGTSDYTYLPQSVKKTIKDHKAQCNKMGSDFFIKECLNLDWNETKFSKKAMNVAKVIRAYDDTGKGPDIVVLEEIENINVVNNIVSKGLSDLGYVTKVLIEGDDTRGIDVAIISKFPVISSKRYPIVFNGVKLDTRGILEVVLNVGGKKVVVFANHWPSQSNPTDHRIASAKVLATAAENARADLVIAAGDFNTLDNERPHPFVAFKNFEDGEQEARHLGVEMIGGTHFYKGEWHSLDHIFILKNSTMKTDYPKFQIMNRSFMMKKDQRSGQMIPYRSDANSGEGFSDHLPMGVEFTY
jgi:endonuclease/exonuclease/phosphatase family metal-dependent hydrolase